jgi:hypothetical protein
MEWHEIFVEILKGLIIVVPLVVSLVKYIKQAIQERNWQQLVALVMNLMAEAEGKFDNGADRKTWVLSMIEASANTINYPIDIEHVGELIDSLCAMSKVVNAPDGKEKIEE